MTGTDDMVRAFFGNGKPRKPSGQIVCSPYFLGVYTAHREFHGRNWRRVKREVNKAAKKLRRANRGRVH